ncbi:MAG: hypothetical protein ABWY20_03230 [Mycobacterium sp.]
MTHLPTCRTRIERFGLIDVHYSEPDKNCTDESHNRFYTEETS